MSTPDIRHSVKTTQVTTEPSYLTYEEMYVICQAFLTKLGTNATGKLEIFISMHDSGSTVTKAEANIRHLAFIPSKKEDGLKRLGKVLQELEPPLTIHMGSLPFIPDRLVRRFLRPGVDK